MIAWSWHGHRYAIRLRLTGYIVAAVTEFLCRRRADGRIAAAERNRAFREPPTIPEE